MKIGIIGAMQEEVAPLINKISRKTTVEKAGKKFSIGQVGDNEIIILETGIGKVNAAIGTTILIETYNPDYIINTGSAGGFHNSLDIGDIILSSEVRYHDVDLTAFGYDFGQMARMPSYYTPDEKLLNLAKKSASILNLITKQGLIASGDTFVHSNDHVTTIQEKFPQIYAVEMEACAVAHTCHIFKTPFLIIRSISDVVDKPNNKLSYEEFLQLASEQAANLIIRMLKLV